MQNTQNWPTKTDATITNAVKGYHVYVWNAETGDEILKIPVDTVQQAESLARMFGAIEKDIQEWKKFL